jgi:glucose-1-phosphate thymidylyltransferase
LKVACLEAIAYEKGWISAERLRQIATPMAGNPYGQYLLKLADRK